MKQSGSAASITPESHVTTRLIPVPEWNEHHSWPPIGGLRHLIHHAEPRQNSRGETIPGNGFATAFKRVGRRVLVDEAEFFRIVHAQNANRRSA